MGSEELLAALRSEGERKAAAITEETRSETDRLRSEAAARLARLGEEYRQRQARAIAAEESAVLAEAERAARHIRLKAADTLGERLLALALRLLPRLRNDDYPDTFRFLAAELPPREWETVRVNPADVELAGSAFPGARIVPDSTICGGLDAAAEGERVRIINTLEKRLERGWQELLPPILAEIENHG